MLKIDKVHHIAIIASDYQKSLDFYVRVLGFSVIDEQYRKERQSYKTELALGNEYVLELFSFPSPPKRLSYPEATGLRHIAFGVNDIMDAVKQLDDLGVEHEEVRINENNGKRFFFFHDPDGLPIELCEI